mmetsp:Transcript_31221/g.101078  ORF Transcript_31221/g.101078 Transcript_31221/m.101078 type:complete len:281 (-) Transcript_31221:62-904(-)
MLLLPDVCAAALHTSAAPTVALRYQHFGPPTPVNIGDGWSGAERIGIAGRDDSSDGDSRKLFHLPGLLPESERATLLSELERREAKFDTELDTVDAQATFMCRIVEGGEVTDTDLAAHIWPVCARLCAYVQERFDSTSACVSEVLIRRYLPTERRRLEAHFDVSAFATCIVSLSEASEYVGGLYVQRVPGVPSRRYGTLEYRITTARSSSKSRIFPAFTSSFHPSVSCNVVAPAHSSGPPSQHPGPCSGIASKAALNLGQRAASHAAFSAAWIAAHWATE